MEEAIDYKALLKKYMSLVIDSEGCDYLFRAREPDFTALELVVLQNMSDELSDE